MPLFEVDSTQPVSPGKDPSQAAESLAETSPHWTKVDFHLHTSEDPWDELEHSSFDLLHRAHALGFGALAITLHDYVLTKCELFERARELGILLIPAAEMRIEGADVIIVNLTEEEARALRRLGDLEELRRRRGRSVLIFAPHPLYVLGGSIGNRRLIEHIDLFDAIEISHFHTRWLNPNRGASRIARQYGKPLLATSDAHRLDFFGHHYTLVELNPGGAPPTPETLFDAIRAGRVRPVSPPWTTPQFIHYAWWIFVEHELRVFQARMGGH